MRFSVVIVTYNDRARLADCLDSIFRQSYPSDGFEIIVIDDGSNDGTAESVSSRFPAVRVVQNQNAGPSASRAAGVKEATGEVIAFIDSDCVAPPDWLANIERALGRDGVKVVGGPIRHEGSLWNRLA